MNTLRFEFSKRNRPDKIINKYSEYTSLDIYIDDKDFRQIVKEYELSCDKVNKELAGTFSFLNIAGLERNYLLGMEKPKH